MNFGQREILVDEDHAIAVLLEQLWEERLVHARAEGALEVIVVNSDHLGILVAAGGATFDINLLHHFSIRILAEVEFGHADQRLPVLGKKKIVILLLVAAVHGDGQRVVIWEFARLQWTQNNLHVSGNAVVGAHLPFDTLGDVSRRGLGGTAQANEQEHKNGTSQKRH